MAFSPNRPINRPSGSDPQLCLGRAYVLVVGRGRARVRRRS
jgi:hypothetical protein